MNDAEKKEQEKIHIRAWILSYVVGIIVYILVFVWNK